jgi:hypothetical protein
MSMKSLQAHRHLCRSAAGKVLVLDGNPPASGAAQAGVQARLHEPPVLQGRLPEILLADGPRVLALHLLGAELLLL